MIIARFPRRTNISRTLCVFEFSAHDLQFKIFSMFPRVFQMCQPGRGPKQKNVVPQFGTTSGFVASSFLGVVAHTPSKSLMYPSYNLNSFFSEEDPISFVDKLVGRSPMAMENHSKRCYLLSIVLEFHFILLHVVCSLVLGVM